MCSDCMLGPQKAEQWLAWAVSVMDPVHVYYKFWMLHSGVGFTNQRQLWGTVGGREGADLRTVGIVKDTRLLFPYSCNGLIKVKTTVKLD